MSDTYNELTNPNKTLLYSVASIVAALTANLAAERKYRSDLAAHNQGVFDLAFGRLQRAVEGRGDHLTATAETREGEKPLALLYDNRPGAVGPERYEEELRRLDGVANDTVAEGVVPSYLLDPVDPFDPAGAGVLKILTASIG